MRLGGIYETRGDSRNRLRYWFMIERLDESCIDEDGDQDDESDNGFSEFVEHGNSL